MSGKSIEFGVLVEGWSQIESTDTQSQFWGDGRQIFSQEEILRHLENDRVLEVVGMISAPERRARGQIFQEIGAELGMPRELLTSFRTRRHFRSGPSREGPPDKAS